MWIEPCEQVSPGLLSVKLLWIYSSFSAEVTSHADELSESITYHLFYSGFSQNLSQFLVSYRSCCNIPPIAMFWWNLVAKGGAELSFNLTWLVLSLDIFTGFCVTMEMGSGFVTVVFQPQDWPPITITKSLKTFKRSKIGFFTFSKL